MSRILQVRRGNSAQNNNFTGLPGEITFDCDAKTLRVHDGTTLGGFPLMRADAATNTFDINTVSDQFWAGLFARFAPTPALMTGTPVPLGATGYIEQIFDTQNTPICAGAYLVCQSPQADYCVGDVVAAFGVGDGTAVAPNTFVDANGLHVRLMTGGGAFWVANKNTGARVNITPENWRIFFRVYC